MTTFPIPPQPTIKTRQELEALVENIVQLQLNRAELEQAQEQEITAIRQRYRAPLAEVERYLTLETLWAETWARENPGELIDQRSLECPHATIGFRAIPTRVERASRRWIWSDIVLKLSEAAWGRRYLRVPSPEVDKEAILADLGKLSPLEVRNVGIKIVQGERFFVTPHGSADGPATSTSEWEEAA